MFLLVAVFSAALAFGVAVMTSFSDANFVTQKVESLNGCVADNYPPTELSFAVAGPPPLVTDEDLQELCPYIRRLGVRGLHLPSTASLT
jgi:hypothetical protein